MSSIRPTQSSTPSHTHKPEAYSLPSEVRDQLTWLRSIEKRAILPLKWLIFFITLSFWVLSHPASLPPPVTVFALFTAYFMFNLGESYLLYFNRVTLKQTRWVCGVSYYFDVLFITTLIYLEAKFYPATDSTTTDFYIFYFLLILRGFALFRSVRSHLIANAVIAAVFVLSIFWQDANLFTYASRNNLIRVVLIWLVILMAWYIVEIINRQKVEIIRTREKLIQSENMALLGEIAAGVAHEINNPIGIISAYTEFLEKTSPPDDPRLEDFAVIKNEAKRCEAIVKELLHYARPNSHELSGISLEEINDDVIKFIRRSSIAETSVTPDIICDYPPVSHLIQGDSTLLKQALLNIYINASQAMINTELPQINVKVSYDQDLFAAHLIISDNGPGIPKEELRRIFDPFFTTKSKGTGLGMSITRRCIEAMDGEILVRSKVGRGTTVEMRFPWDQA